MLKHSQRYDLSWLKTAINKGFTNTILLRELTLLMRSKVVVIAAALREGLIADITDINLTSEVIELLDTSTYPSITKEEDIVGWDVFYRSWKDFVFETFVCGVADQRWFDDTIAYETGYKVINKMSYDDRADLQETRLDDFCLKTVLWDKDVKKLIDKIAISNINNNRKNITNN